MTDQRAGPPPPDRPGHFLQRARELLRRALASATASAHRGLESARRAGERLGSESRRRWPQLRDRVRRWERGMDRRAQKALSGVGPALGRSGRWLRRRVPSPRQAALLVVLVVGPAWVLWERCGFTGCPDVDHLTAYQPGGASVLLDRNGEKFADLAPMDYDVVPLDSLPPYVGQAFIAVEDRRFLEHGGVDWRRVLGAMWADIVAGSLVQGSSTLSMQLSRTLFSDRIRREEKTFRRKLLEVRVAGEIEERFSKREILELYLNHIYLGGGSYGVQGASRYYFGKDARDLDLAEAALLAALPKAPSNYDPRRHPKTARARRDLVLALMEEQALVPFAEAQSARTRELGVSPEPDRDRDGDRLAPYFIQHVRGLLEERIGDDLYERPLRVLTTLDPEAQQAAEAELEAQLRIVEGGRFGRLRAPSYQSVADPDSDDTAYLQGAVVVMDATRGDVRAWVGGRDYDHSRFDRARLARRQAGSAFKPFIYGAALEARFAASQPIMDEPFRLARRGARDWEPENYSGQFEGRMSMRDALVRSQNVPAVRLAAAVGEDRVRDFAERAGITGEVPASPVAALGVTALSPLEMTVAYTTFAGLGTRVAPRFVLRVETADGDTLWEASQPERTTVTDTATAFLLTDLLKDVVDRGTGTGVRGGGFYGSAAGKTGTTNDATDVWFVGYTPDLVGTVWIGFDEVRPLPYRATGGGVAAPIWGRIMARAYGGDQPSDWWNTPANVVSLEVDPETGLALREGCRSRWGDVRRELFVEGEEPISVCPRRARRGFFRRLDDWAGTVFRYREPPPRIPGSTDPHLGVPRLPRQADAPASDRYGPDRYGTDDRDYDDYEDDYHDDYNYSSRRGDDDDDPYAAADPDRDAYVRSARIPAGHHPPPGECRVWYPGRSPGRQPAPTRCGALVGRVPLGTFLLYDGRAWDTRYDWSRQHSARPGSVPEIVLHIMNSVDSR